MSILHRVTATIALASLVATSMVFAETGSLGTGENSSTTRAGAARDQMMQKREEAGQRQQDLKAQAEQNKKEAQARMDVRRKQLVRAYAERTVKRFTEAVTRLENIADRIGSRLDKLATQNASVTDARAKLAIARTKIAAARTAVDSLTSAISIALASDTPKAQFEKVRIALQDTEKKIKEAHTALVDTINSIKPGTIRATTAPSTGEHE